MNRREFVAGGIATAALLSGCASPGKDKPAFYAGAKYPDGQYGIEALSADLGRHSLLKSPHRLHGFAASPDGKWLVAPARRPGTRLEIFNLHNGNHNSVTAAPNRHFYGHGVFSISGDYFFATENDYDAERGIVAIYDPYDRFKRLDEIDSGGIGPHEISLAPNGQSLMVANGGILTHPDFGRKILNPGAIASSLARISLPHFRIVDQIALPENHASLSLRHMAITTSDTVIVGAQDQAPGPKAAPLMWHWRKDGLHPLSEPDAGWRKSNAYIGSVAINDDLNLVAASSPRANRVVAWDIKTGDQKYAWSSKDICGLGGAGHAHPFVATTGQGDIMYLSRNGIADARNHDLRFDNHLLVV